MGELTNRREELQLLTSEASMVGIFHVFVDQLQVVHRDLERRVPEVLLNGSNVDPRLQGMNSMAVS